MILPVQILLEDIINAGEHSILFNAKSLASGNYIYKLNAGNIIQSKIMTLLK